MSSALQELSGSRFDGSRSYAAAPIAANSRPVVDLGLTDLVLTRVVRKGDLGSEALEICGDR